MNGCKTLNFGTVNVGEMGKECVGKCYKVLSVKCEDANVNDSKTSNFGTFVERREWNGTCREMLPSAECEMVRCKCKLL